MRFVEQQLLCRSFVPSGCLFLGARVCAEVNGVAYRSALMKNSGVFHLGIHEAVLTEVGVDFGERLQLSIERRLLR